MDDQQVGDASILRAAADILWERYHEHGQGSPPYVAPIDNEEALHYGNVTGTLLRVAQELTNEWAYENAKRRKQLRQATLQRAKRAAKRKPAARRR